MDNCLLLDISTYGHMATYGYIHMWTIATCGQISKKTWSNMDNYPYITTSRINHC